MCNSFKQKNMAMFYSGLLESYVCGTKVKCTPWHSYAEAKQPEAEYIKFAVLCRCKQCIMKACKVFFLLLLLLFVLMCSVGCSFSLIWCQILRWIPLCWHGNRSQEYVNNNMFSCLLVIQQLFSDYTGKQRHQKMELVAQNSILFNSVLFI